MTDPTLLLLCIPCLAVRAKISCQLTLAILKLDRAPPCLGPLMEEKEGALCFWRLACLVCPWAHMTSSVCADGWCSFRLGRWLLRTRGHGFTPHLRKQGWSCMRLIKRPRGRGCACAGTQGRTVGPLCSFPTSRPLGAANRKLSHLCGAEQARLAVFAQEQHEGAVVCSPGSQAGISEPLPRTAGRARRSAARKGGALLEVGLCLLPSPSCVTQWLSGRIPSHKP